jgi:hypothetical protein
MEKLKPEQSDVQEIAISNVLNRSIRSQAFY